MAASFARYLRGKAVFSVCLLKAGCADGLKGLGVGCVIVGPAPGLIISSLITNKASKVERKELFRQCSTSGWLWCLSKYSCTFFEYLNNILEALLCLIETLSQKPQ